jgi:hypothetical protein
VVGVSFLDPRDENELGAEPAQRLDDDREVRGAGRRIDETIREPQVLAERQPHRSSGGLGLAPSLFGVALGSQLPSREVDDARAVAEVRQSDQDAAAEQLDVVRMGSEGQNVDAVGRVRAHSSMSSRPDRNGVAWPSTRAMKARGPYRAANQETPKKRSCGMPRGCRRD